MTPVSTDSSPWVVVDASVSLKWVLDDEQAVGQAVALRDAAVGGRFAMVAPSLWLYETTNGLVTAVRRGRLSPALVAEAIADLLALGIRLADPEAVDVFALAIRHGLSGYDAAYLALADALGAPLWTGDVHMYNAVRGVTDVVHWIGDYDSGS